MEVLFSILTQEFKKNEIKTIEELFLLIENSPMSPRPECESLQFIWNWRDYISEHLSDKDLKNHSFYNAFKISKEKTVTEGMVTKLRCKRLPQDEDWEPPTGIRLVKANTPYDPVASADFRVNDLLLPKIMENLQKYFRRMPTHQRVKVDNSWGRLKDMLESLPRKQQNLPRMRIKDLPKLSDPLEPKLPDEYDYIEEDVDGLPEIIGDIFEENLFDANVCVDLDVVVYTECSQDRPWVGRVKEVLEGKRFTIQWFCRQGKSLKFHAMFNSDKTPYVSELENSNVMMWEISVQKNISSFHVTPYKMSRMIKEYKKYDDVFQSGSNV